MKNEKRKHKGRFARGTSGNPSGRPPGSRNQSTLLMEALLEGEAERLTRKAVELALAGDTQAMRLCLDRLMPPGRDRVVFFEFPPIHNLDIPQAMMSIMVAISEGKLTPPEGEQLSRILSDYAKAMTTQDVERRLQKLEKARLSPEDLSEEPRPDQPELTTRPEDLM
jgi:hypothetical protein